mgnify:CR=1 FL=1
MILKTIRFAKHNSDDAKKLLYVMDNTGLSDIWRKRYKFPEEKIVKILKQRISERRYILIELLENPFTFSKRVGGYVIFDSADKKIDDLPGKYRKKNQNEYAYCYGIGVHSNYRNRGIAKQLYDFAFKEAKREGYKGLYADIDRDNVGSLKLHDRLGFTKICEYKSKSRANQSGHNVVFLKTF